MSSECSTRSESTAETAANSCGSANPALDGSSNGVAAPPPASAEAAAAAAVQRARECGPDYTEEEGRDFQGQPLTKCKPLLKLVGVNNPSFTEADETWGPPIRPKAVNHVAIGANDVDAIARFYTKVLGIRAIPRPDIGFPGHWLKGCGIMIHVIQNDPKVPRTLADWKEGYASEPEAWFIRRGCHLVGAHRCARKQALEVEDFEEAERLLRRHGVEYSRHVLPEANMRQLLFYDSEGNGVEVGTYEDTWNFLREHGEECAWL